MRHVRVAPVRRGHAHFWERALTRRQFVGATAGVAGAALGTGLLAPTIAWAGDAGFSPPKPIPGGIQPAPGGPVFHVFLPAAGAELSTITDFNGAVGATDVQGTGTGSEPDGRTHPLLFDADMRFMRGVYVGVDGAIHRATFAFV
jgi:hypothetical protein